MKKLLLIVSALCALLVFVACANKETPSNKITVEEYTTTSVSSENSTGNSNPSSVTKTETSSTTSDTTTTTTPSTATPSTTGSLTNGGTYSDTGSWGTLYTS